MRACPDRIVIINRKINSFSSVLNEVSKQSQNLKKCRRKAAERRNLRAVKDYQGYVYVPTV